MPDVAADATGPFCDQVRDLLIQAPAVHFDETGGRVQGSLHWLHSASTSLLTLLGCHKRRGRVAMDDLGVLGAMSGVAIHDGWKLYRHYDIDHALCNAHHLRELIAVGIGWDQTWANDLADLLREAKRTVAHARATGSDQLDPATLHSIRVRYGQLVAKGFSLTDTVSTGNGTTCCGSQLTSPFPSTIIPMSQLCRGAREHASQGGDLAEQFGIITALRGRSVPCRSGYSGPSLRVAGRCARVPAV